MIALLALIAVVSAAAPSPEILVQRSRAAVVAGDPDSAMTLAAEALRARPLDLEAHRAWQRALLGRNLGWRLDAEYASMAASDDPDRALYGQWWLALREGSVLLPPEGADPELSQLLVAQTAHAVGSDEVALHELEGLVSAEASALRMRAYRSQGDTSMLRAEARLVLAEWPDRPDAQVPFVRREVTRMDRLLRRRVLNQAEGLVESDDALTVYRAWLLFAAARERELAAGAAERLAELGEPWPLGDHLAYPERMVRDLGKVVALHKEPRLPGVSVPAEEQRVLAAAARQLSRKGRHDSAAGVWRMALERGEFTPDISVEALQALERVEAPVDEVLALCLQAERQIAEQGLAGEDGSHARRLLSEVHSVRARALRRTGELDQALVAATLATALGGTPDDLILRSQLLEAAGQTEAAFESLAEAAHWGAPGLEADLQRLYSGPGDVDAVLAAWPRQARDVLVQAANEDHRFPEITLDSSAGPVSVAGGAPVVIVFWASWCKPCKAELPELDHLVARLAEEELAVDIVAVSVDERRRDMDAWLQRNPLGALPTAWGPDLGASVRLLGVPSTYLVGPDGRVLYFHQGYAPGDLERLETTLRSMLE